MISQFKKLALGSVILLNGVTAFAQDEYMIRVPVQAAVHSPEIVNFELGTVIIGSEPRVSTFFVNKSSEPTQVELVQTSGRARILTNECLGQTLAPNATCKLDMSLISNTLGDISGSVTVYHTKAANPNIYNMVAKVINASDAVRFDESLMNFGTQTVRTATTRVATLRNTGSEPVFIVDVGFVSASSSFKILNSNCSDELAPGGSCTVTFEFKPLMGGNTSARVFYELEDGTRVTGLTLQGQGAFAALTWGSSGLVFENVPVGQVSEAKPVAILNSGTGTMTINSLKIMEGGVESSNFKIKTSYCPNSLSGSQSCNVEIDFRSTTEGDKFAVLEANVSGATSSTYRLQMAAKTITQRASFEFVPTSLNFSNVAFGSTATLPLTIRSTGQIPLVVSNYSITGADSTHFSSQASSCIGSLDPGMECTFNVTFNSSKAGANSALLNVAANHTDPFSGVPLTANAVRGILNVDPGFVVFNTTEIGQTRSQILTLNNPSPYALSISSISIADSNNFAVSGNCVGPLAANQSCQATLTYQPKSAQNHASTVRILSNSTSPDISVPVSGVGANPPEPVVSLTAFECNNPIQIASCSTFGCQTPNVTCQATMTNTGSVNIPSLPAATVSNPQFRVSSCTSLNVGQNCTVTLSGVSATLGAQTVTYTTTIGNQTLSRVAGFTVSQSSLELTTNNHALTYAGQPNTATHTLRNNGLFSIPFSSVSVSSSTALSLTNHNCPATLNPNQSCQITTTCSSATPNTYNADLSVQSFKTETKQISCVVSPAPAQTGQITLTPNPYNFGILKVGQNATTLLTLTNNNASNTQAASLSTLTLAGTNAADFSVTRESCTTSLAPGQSCTIRLNHTPSSVGAKQAVVNFTVNNSPISASVGSTAAVASFSLSPTSLNFGNHTTGETSTTLQSTLTNNGQVSARLLSLTQQGSADFSRSGTCTPNLDLAAGQSCTIRYSVNSSQVGPKAATLNLAFSDSIANLALNLNSTAIAPLSFTGTSSLSCPASAATSSSFTCQATISSTGTGTLNVSSAQAAQSAGPGAPRSFTTPSWNCTAGSSISAIAPGSSCQTSFSVPTTTAGTYNLSITPPSNGQVTASQATTSVQGPIVALTTTDHPVTARSASSSATHTLSNSGLAPASITSITSSNPSITVSNSCSSIAAGQSCTFSTSCLSTTAQQITATLTAQGNFGSISRTTNCSVQAPSLQVERLSPLSSIVPAYTTSGNWLRITNNGAGSIVPTGFTAAPGWTLFRSSTDTTHCSTSRALQAGQSCFVLEALNGSQGPNLTVSGNHTITSNVLSPLTVAASTLNTRGINISNISAFAPVQVSGQTQATFRITNEAPAPAASLAVSASGSGYSILSNNCPATLNSNQSCDVIVRFTAGTTPATTSGTLSVASSYPSIVSNEIQPGQSSVRTQASLTMSNTSVAARVVLTAGSYAPIEIGQSLDVTHTLSNQGVGPVNLTGNPVLSSTSQHTVVGGTCSSGLVVNAGSSCTIITRFTPTTTSQVSVTLTNATSVGAVSAGLTGRVLPASDLSVSVTAATSVLKNSTVNHSLTVRNTGSSRVTALVNFGIANSQGAQAYLRSITSSVCGTQTYSAQGALLSSTAGTASSSVSCSIAANGRDLILSLASNAVFSGTAVVDAGPNTGAFTYSLVGTLQDATETNSTNNQASGTITVSNPFADLSITMQLGSSSYTYNWPDGFINITLRNLSSGTSAADQASGVVSLTTAGVTNNASVVIGAGTCLSATAGSTCQNNGQVVIAKGGTVQFRFPLSTGPNVGSVTLNGTISNLSPETSDPNSANNSASTTLTINNSVVAKLCMFNSYKQGVYLGQDQFNELENKSNDGNGWASVNYPNPTRSTDNPFTGFVSLRSWLRWHLFDGWEQLTHNVPNQTYTGTTKWYLDPLKAVWKGTNIPVQTSFNSGSRFWFIDKPPVPVVLYSHNGATYMHFSNWDSAGTFYGAILGYSDYSNDYGSNGSVTPLGGNYVYFWRPYKDNNFSRAWKNAKSEGTSSQGQLLRQGWIEHSPGGSCIVPGTTLISRQNLPTINPAAYSQ